ncbi:MAG: hypothetical protein IT480_14710 [Gammaproteobacteria bacterium]|nr:hypothetical protein [Gammaproteobacteria bacterium]
MNGRMHLLATLLSALLLSACSSNGDPAIGGGQASGTATVDFAIAYIKRELPTDPALLAELRGLDDARQHRPYWTRADVYLRDRAAPSGVERNLTESVTSTGRYDIKDLNVSFDGTRLVFAMRGPIADNQMFHEPPSWHIWQYDTATSTLAQITGGPTDTNPDAQDVSPHYLADGRVVFSSTRQRDAKAVLTGEGKANFEAQTEDGNESAFVLHTLEIDPATHEATSIRQISFNQSHDTGATLLANGRIMYSRWDNAAGRNGGGGIHLYSAHPDGRDVQLLYGSQSHATGSTAANPVQFVAARELQDGRVLALVRPSEPLDFGGILHIIDVANYVEIGQPVKAGSPLTGPAQTAATPNDVRTIPSADPAAPLPSPGGRFNSAFPLWDSSNRILVSWSQCRLLDTTGRIVPCTADNLADASMTAAPPLYSAWLFDPAGNTFKPVIEPVENRMIEDVVSLQPRTTPDFIADGSATTQLAADGLGILDIRSVYDWDGVETGAGAGGIAGAAQRPADGRPARFLRIEKPVSLGDEELNDGFPDYDDDLADDRNMREILGYVPIEPDGSVRVKVPANVAFRIAILDANARRIAPEHTSWLQLRPGEVLACNGCHQGGAGTSHGRRDLWAADGAFASIWSGASAAGVAFPGTAGTSAILPNCAGATMAQARYGLPCSDAGTPDVQDANPASAATPSVNVGFTDEWFGGGAGNAPIAYDYAALSTPRPTSFACASSWNSGCRITINYAPSGATAPTPSAAIIDPLWAVSRGAVPSGGSVGADTCVNCHAVRAGPDIPCTLLVNGVTVSQPVPQVLGPAAGLDLSADPAQDPAAQLRAYQQLMNGHTSPGNSGVDTTTCTQTAATAQNFPASISPGSANASTRFFGVFAAGGSHAGRLTGAELRLLSEWVDIGAQYYNNPFNAPLN